MRQLLVSSLAAAAVLVAVSEAAACVPMRYEMTDITAESMATAMVRDAASVEIMRAVSRIQVPAHHLYASTEGPIYEYRFESTEILKGARRGVLSFTAPDQAWSLQRWSFLRRRVHRPLWWLEPEGYASLQDTSIFLANDFDSTTCAGPVLFELGQQYLIFRGADGRLLAPGFRGRSGWQDVPRGQRIQRQRPALEQLHGANDPWLTAVRNALRAESRSAPN